MQRMMSVKPLGFTLIELMIAVVVVSILAAIAIPSYSSHVRKTERKVAVGKILEIAGRLEQFKTQRFSYPTGDDLAQFALTEKRYAYTVEAVSNGEGYNVVATPVAGTDQVNDVCGTLEYTNESVWDFKDDLTQAECL